MDDLKFFDYYVTIFLEVKKTKCVRDGTYTYCPIIT